MDAFMAGKDGKETGMAKRLETLKEKARWFLWLLAAAAIAILAGSLETGRVHAANTAFTFLGAISNIITPNGDGLNDVALLCFDNPRSSEVTGTIYDLHGRKVSGMTRDGSNTGCPPPATAEKLAWNGRQDGRKVSSGIYIYKLQSEGTTITGTVMVVR